MSKKMCKEWNGDMETTPCNLNEYYSGTCHYRAFKKCNSKCEIITKPKPRMVRVKAWIRITEQDMGWNKCPLRWAATKKGGDYNTPVTILIDRKYLTTRKKDK